MRVGEVLVSCRVGVNEREINREVSVDVERPFLTTCLSHVVWVRYSSRNFTESGMRIIWDRTERPGPLLSVRFCCVCP